MKLLDKLIRWRLRHRHAAHRRWAREAKAVFTFTSPAPDTRNWQGKFMRSRKP